MTVAIINVDCVNLNVTIAGFCFSTDIINLIKVAL